MRSCLLESKVCIPFNLRLMSSEYVLLATQPISTKENGVKSRGSMGVELPVRKGYLVGLIIKNIEQAIRGRLCVILISRVDFSRLRMGMQDRKKGGKLLYIMYSFVITTEEDTPLYSKPNVKCLPTYLKKRP